MQVNVKKKNKMKVQTAIARKMLVCMWNMLSKKEDYKEFLREGAGGAYRENKIVTVPGCL